MKFINTNTKGLFVLLFMSLQTVVYAHPNKHLDSFKFAFWNLENACDTIDDPWADDDFTPTGTFKWNTEKYQAKLLKLASVIDSLNADVMGFCEIEKLSVLNDLFTQNSLKTKSFKLIEYDSPDERGIDVAFAYNPEKFDYLNSSPLRVDLNNDKTRDILWVTLKLKHSKDTLHFFICHFPSRRSGAEITREKRAKAAQILKDYLYANHLENKNLIIAGDFNDNPVDSSINKVLGACKPVENTKNCNLQNLAMLFDPDSNRTTGGPKSGALFDQIIVSYPLWNGNNKLMFKRSGYRIFAPYWLQQHDGKFAGYPWRNFGGKNWLNGYSDHFPVSAVFTYAKK